MVSRKLAHLVKDICQNNQRNESQGRNNVKVTNMIRGGENRKRPFEGERSGLTDELAFLAIPRNRLTNEPIILEGMIEDHQVRRILVDGESSSEIMYEHCFKNLSFNIRSRLRRKEQNGTDGVCDSKMSFAVQRHNRKDRNEKPQSSRFHHLFYDQIPNKLRNRDNEDK
ncbi:hypothetical protein Tco_0152067 [Tanacetum coccineum]